MENSAKFKFGTGLCLLFLMSSGAAHAESWYIGGSGDVSWWHDTDTGGGANIDLGYRLAPDIRIEAEAGYHDLPGSGGTPDEHYFTYMGNLYYDFNSLGIAAADGNWRIVPYIGGGIGDASIHIGSSNFANTFHHHDNEFAYEGMGGLSLASSAMPNADWFLAYRYQGADENDIEANNVELGVRFHF